MGDFVNNLGVFCFVKKKRRYVVPDQQVVIMCQKNLEMIQKEKERKNETSKNGYNERFF